MGLGFSKVWVWGLGFQKLGCRLDKLLSKLPHIGFRVNFRDYTIYTTSGTPMFTLNGPLIKQILTVGFLKRDIGDSIGIYRV